MAKSKIKGTKKNRVTVKDKGTGSTITKDMTFAEALQKNSKAGEIMFRYGLHCIGCHVASFETIEQGAQAHGLSDAELKKMIKEINEAK